MDSTDTSSMVEDLDDALDDLEFALKPLLTEDMANQLPVLERSKLYVLTVYAIESIIFSYLRVNGIQAKEHPVFRELARVKQYFEKIKATEFSEEKPNLRLDRPAAGRLLKHALAEKSYKSKRQAEPEQPAQVQDSDRPSKKPRSNKDQR